VADSIFDARSDAGKSFSFNFHHRDFFGARESCPGLVVHPLVSAEVQVRLLALVDGASKATLEDCISALPGHPSPVSAVLALANAGLLEIERGTLSATSRVFRGAGAANGVPDANPVPLKHRSTVLSEAAMRSLQGSVVYRQTFATKLEGSDFKPEIFVFDLKAPPLTHDIGMPFSRPSVCFGLRENHLTFGTVSAGGRAPSWDGYDKLIVLLDHSRSMTVRLAEVAKRILGLSFDEMDRHLLDGPVPEGDQCSAAEYEQMRVFISEALLILRRNSVAFTQYSQGFLMAGPQGPFDVLYGTEDVTDSEDFALEGDDFAARGVHQPGAWIVNQGSHVKSAPLGFSETGTSQLRHELNFSGVIEMQGENLVVTSPLRFPTASAAADFVSGSPNVSWIPIGPTHR